MNRHNLAERLDDLEGELGGDGTLRISVKYLGPDDDPADVPIAWTVVFHADGTLRQEYSPDYWSLLSDAPPGDGDTRRRI